MTRASSRLIITVPLLAFAILTPRTTLADDDGKSGKVVEVATLYDPQTLKKISSLPIGTPVEIQEEKTDLSDVRWLVLTATVDGEVRSGMVLASKVRTQEIMIANGNNLPQFQLPEDPDAVFDLGLRVLRKVGGQDENAIVSPYGLWANARFWLLAARGDTRTRLDRSLGISENVSRETIADASVRTVNRVLRREEVNFKPSFSELLAAANVECVVSSFDESARRDLNGWIQKWSDDQIVEFYPESTWNSSTSVLLVNCLSLDAKWQSPFRSKFTKEKKFTLSSGQQIVTQMMLQKSTMKWISNDELAIDGAVLPYEGGELSCVILVPRSQSGIDSLVESMNAQQFRRLMENANSEDVVLSLPKLQLEKSFSPFDALGLSSELAKGSDFSGMTESRIKLAEVYQAVKLSADEAGTKAAAATGSTFFPSAPSESIPKTLTADHPFLVLIVHQPTLTPLIIARVNRPVDVPSNPKE